MSATTNTALSAVLDQLASSLTGELVRPGDGAYDEARSVWNGMIDLQPVAVARCASTGDVVAALRVAREAGIPIAVRGGGHNVAGFGTIDEGLVVDLSPMRDVTVDATTRRVRAGGGATLKHLDAATQAHGLVVPGGVVSDTGVAGLTLNGGLGWVRRKWGLSCDNLVGVELVTADGTVLRADEQSDPELMWGLRGGGGNFGVVTEFEFEARPSGPRSRSCSRSTPSTRHERSSPTTSGSCSAAETRSARSPCSAMCRPSRTSRGAPRRTVRGRARDVRGTGRRGRGGAAAVARAGDAAGRLHRTDDLCRRPADLRPEYPAGHRYYWKSTNLPSMPVEAVDVLVEQMRRAPSRHSTIDVWLNGGAIERVADDATAFSGRDGRYVVNPEANWEDPADDTANVAWAREVLAALEPYASDGAYLNFPGFLEEGQSLVRASMGGNYERLAQLKKRLDPENLFRRNANVEPAA